jgi:hypothetical protein
MKITFEEAIDILEEKGIPQDLIQHIINYPNAYLNIALLAVNMKGPVWNLYKDWFPSN